MSVHYSCSSVCSSLSIIGCCCKVIMLVDGQGADLGQLNFANLSACWGRGGRRLVYRCQDPLPIHRRGVLCIRRSGDGCPCTPHVTSTHSLTHLHTKFAALVQTNQMKNFWNGLKGYCMYIDDPVSISTSWSKSLNSWLVILRWVL